jgi:hypothetical protein
MENHDTFMTLHHFGAPNGPVVDWFVSNSHSELSFGVVPSQLSSLREFALSLNEVSQVRNSYNVLRLLVHIDEPQLTILPFGGQIDAHQHSQTKTIQVRHVF